MYLYSISILTMEFKYAYTIGVNRQSAQIYIIFWMHAYAPLWSFFFCCCYFCHRNSIEMECAVCSFFIHFFFSYRTQNSEKITGVNHLMFEHFLSLYTILEVFTLFIVYSEFLQNNQCETLHLLFFKKYLCFSIFKQI